MKRFLQKLGSKGFYKNKKFWVFTKLRKTRISKKPIGKNKILTKKSKLPLNFE